MCAQLQHLSLLLLEEEDVEMPSVQQGYLQA